MTSNCGVAEDSWKSLGQQGDKNSHLKGNPPWILIGRTDAEAEALGFWCEQPTHWKSSWCLEILKAEGEKCVRG